MTVAEKTFHCVAFVMWCVFLGIISRGNIAKHFSVREG